jgi:hypothetical protein
MNCLLPAIQGPRAQDQEDRLRVRVVVDLAEVRQSLALNLVAHFARVEGSRKVRSPQCVVQMTQIGPDQMPEHQVRVYKPQAIICVWMNLENVLQGE